MVIKQLKFLINFTTEILQSCDENYWLFKKKDVHLHSKINNKQ